MYGIFGEEKYTLGLVKQTTKHRQFKHCGIKQSCPTSRHVPPFACRYWEWTQSPDTGQSLPGSTGVQL